MECFKFIFRNFCKKFLLYLLVLLHLSDITKPPLVSLKSSVVCISNNRSNSGSQNRGRWMDGVDIRRLRCASSSDSPHRSSRCSELRKRRPTRPSDRVASSSSRSSSASRPPPSRFEHAMDISLQGIRFILTQISSYISIFNFQHKLICVNSSNF